MVAPVALRRWATGPARPAAKAGLIMPGCYQLNVVVPASAADGDNTLTVSYGGFSTPAGAVIAVQR